MLALIIAIAIFVISIVAYIKLDDCYCGPKMAPVSVFVIVVGALDFSILILMLLSACINNFAVDGQIAKFEQRYESLTYQVENDIYDNDNDLGKKELYDQVTAWNEDLAMGKTMQYDKWFGVFYPNIYDHFDFIDLPEIN